jgi:hypothetical protein
VTPSGPGPREQIAAMLLLQKALADLAAIEVESAQRDKDRDAQLPPDFLFRRELDQVEATQVRQPRIGQADDGRYVNPRDAGAGARDVRGSPSVGRGGGGSGLVKSLTGALKGVGGLLAARFMAVLGPLAIFAQVLSVTNSGFQVFATTMKVLAATIAPILLPVFAVLAAAILAVSEKLWREILPALGDFYQFIVTHFLPAAGKAVNNSVATDTSWGGILMRGAVPPQLQAGLLALQSGGMNWMVKKLATGAQKLGVAERGDDLVRKMGLEGVSRRFGRFFNVDLPPEKKDAAGKDAAGKDAAKPGEVDINAKMRDVMQSLSLAMGPKAQFSGITTAARNVQLAALNADPIEKQIVALNQQAVGLLTRVEANTRPKQDPGFAPPWGGAH